MSYPPSERLLREQFGPGAPPLLSRAPGRINLIGEHTDYNGGYVLPFAIDRVTEIAVRPRADRRIRIYADAFRAGVELELPMEGIAPAGSWQDYPIGILAELSHYKDLEFGFDGAISGDVPQGAGLSSSAALEVAAAIAFSRLYGVNLSGLELVRLCQRVENEFVGTRCGIMDQYVSYFGRTGAAILLNTHTMEHRYVPLHLSGVSLLAVDSRVNRSLGTSGYNARRQECEQALTLVRSAFPERNIASLSDLTIGDLDRISAVLSPSIFARVRHVVSENARVLAAVEALEQDDYRRLGELLFASHASLRDLFEVSTPELDFLVDWGREHGALGARLVGGGFGGVVLHLVPDEIKQGYIDGIVAAYRARFRIDPEVIEVRPGPGAEELNRA